MKLRLKNVNPGDNAKLFAGIYAILGALYVVGGAVAVATGQPGGMAIIIMGILLPVMGWIVGWISTWITNFILKKINGVRIEFDEV